MILDPRGVPDGAGSTDELGFLAERIAAR